MMNLKAKITRLLNVGTRGLVEFEIDKQFLDLLSTLGNAEVELTICKPKKKRSLDANAYCWVLIGKLASVLRVPKEEVYRNAIRDIGDNFVILCMQEKACEKFIDAWHRNGLGWITDTFESKIEGCVNVMCYYGSSSYDTEQMSRLIDYIVCECKEQGIQVLTDSEIALLKEEWH